METSIYSIINHHIPPSKSWFLPKPFILLLCLTLIFLNLKSVTKQASVVVLSVIFTLSIYSNLPKASSDDPSIFPIININYIKHITCMGSWRWLRKGLHLPSHQPWLHIQPHPNHTPSESQCEIVALKLYFWISHWMLYGTVCYCWS